MSIQAKITSTDLNRQIEVLKYYPEVLKKYFRSGMKRSVQALESFIRPTIPRATGFAESTFGSKVTGSGISLTGRVGWFDQGDPFYINIVESGAEEHEIVPRAGNRPTYSAFKAGKGASSVLRFLGDGGTSGDEFTFSRVVHHPGFSKRGFMAAGFSAMKPVIEAEMANAAEDVMKELALK